MSTVVGIFKDELDAVNAMEELRDMGYLNEDFSVFKKDEIQYKYLLERDTNEDPNGIYKKDQTIEDGRRMEGLIFGLEAHRIIDTFPVVGAGPLATNMRYDLAAEELTPMESLERLGTIRDDAELYEKSLHLGYTLISVETSILKKHQIEEVFRRNNSLLKEDVNAKFQDSGVDMRYRTALDTKIKEGHPGVDKYMHPEVGDRLGHTEGGVDKSIHPEIDKVVREDEEGVDKSMHPEIDKVVREDDEGVDKSMHPETEKAKRDKL